MAVKDLATNYKSIYIRLPSVPQYFNPTTIQFHSFHITILHSIPNTRLLLPPLHNPFHYVIITRVTSAARLSQNDNYAVLWRKSNNKRRTSIT